jgi:molybdopterin-guanine dinucleotide biosynthesis protein A
MHSDTPSGFILAGGKSTRMGTDKAFLVFRGRTLLEQALELGRCVTGNVTIVGAPEKFGSFAPVVEDIFPDCGPLGGIHAALRSSKSEFNLILAVDLPFISPALLQHLLKKAALLPNAIVTIPYGPHGWQPLCAVYRGEFVDMAEKSLRAGRYKIDVLFDKGWTQTISEEELQAAGFSPGMFRNLNTPDDFADASL